jgi:hypothetical protein
MACELWVRGDAENGGRVFVDVPVGPFVSGQSYPTLTLLGTSASGYKSYSATPSWQYNVAGWYTYPEFYTKGCGLNPNVPCDCINGGCVPKTTYNTPGVFANLAACQSGCAKNSNCTGECVDPAEIAAHRQALNNLQAKICR